ncbi:hypothetical protein NL676_008504 [Syzygium grande]|nr:hypothetical protein NL676_008504 [Syzygium grande]
MSRPTIVKANTTVPSAQSGVKSAIPHAFVLTSVILRSARATNIHPLCPDFPIVPARVEDRSFLLPMLSGGHPCN